VRNSELLKRPITGAARLRTDSFGPIRGLCVRGVEMN
jgi:hypothetical protein